MKINSTSEVLTYLYQLSLNQSSFRFRGQADESWKIRPSIYRYCGFLRYQTTLYEKELLVAKPPKANPPLTHTDFDLEWLMVCQHYEIPTRLVDWSTDILSALFFASYGSKEMAKDGALYICKQSDYPLYSNYKESLANNQELAFVSTYVMNPRMRNQSGCFMMWGHSPKDNSTETYDLQEYHEQKGSSFYLEKLIIPSVAKKNILKELEKYYSIIFDSIYLKNGDLETTYGSGFKNLKELARLVTLHLTDANRLSEDENKKVIQLSGGIDRTNMFCNCVNLRKV
jgi:hypothetical protein